MQKITKNLAISELKFQDDQRVIEGYASTFGNVDSAGDIIQRGAFVKSLASRKVKFFYQHNWSKVIGKILEIREDTKGLYIKAQIARTELGDEIYELLKMDALDSFSIGFCIPQSGFTYDGKTGIRTIKEADLYEVSVVSIPANDKATVTTVKSMENIREFERYLKELGFSNQESEIIASKSWTALQSLREGGVESPTQGEPANEELKALNNLLTIIKGNKNDN